MPIADLKDLKSHFDSIVFVSYLTVEPEKNSVNEYVERMISELSDENTHLWYIGRMGQYISKDKISDRLSVFSSINELVENI
jgi:hypothetical protein